MNTPFYLTVIFDAPYGHCTDTDALEGPLKKVYTQYKWALIWLYGAKVYIIYTMG